MIADAVSDSQMPPDILRSLSESLHQRRHPTSTQPGRFLLLLVQSRHHLAAVCAVFDQSALPFAWIKLSWCLSCCMRPAFASSTNGCAPSFSPAQPTGSFGYAGLQLCTHTRQTESCLRRVNLNASCPDSQTGQSCTCVRIMRLDCMLCYSQDPWDVKHLRGSSTTGF